MILRPRSLPVKISPHYTIAIGGTFGTDRKDVYHECNSCSHYKGIISNDVERQMNKQLPNLRAGKGIDRNGKEREICEQCQGLKDTGRC